MVAKSTLRRIALPAGPNQSADAIARDGRPASLKTSGPHIALNRSTVGERAATRLPKARLYFVEATARRNEASGNPQRFDRAMLLDRSHTGSVGLDAAGNLDFARRTTGFGAQGDGGEVDQDPLDQRRSGTAERLDAAAHDQPSD